MDYILEAADFGERGFAVVLTRWNNFGAGIDPTDMKWQSHITVIGPQPRHEPQLRYEPHHVGDIRKGFESQATMSVDELTKDNKRKMFSSRKSRLLCQGSDGLAWKWYGGNRWYLAPPQTPQPRVWRYMTEGLAK
jgi:hypothetical protein